MTTRPIKATHRLGAFLALTGTIASLVATLTPAPGQAGAAASTSLFCLVCGEGGGTDVFLNLLVFTPMAVGLRLLGWPWRRVVIAAALLSLAVEFLQLALVPGRDSSLSDLLSNTTGAAVAAALAPHLPRALVPDPVLARRLLLGAAAFQLVVLTLSAIGFLPSVRPGRLRSDCTSYSPAFGTWSGTLRSVRIDGIPLPCDDDLADGASVRAALAGGHTAVHIEGAAGAPTSGRAAVHAVRAGGEPVLALAQDGNSAVFNVPTLSRRLRFSAVTLQLPDAFPRDAGTTFDLRAGRDGHRLWISSQYPGQRRSAEVMLRPSLGWINLLWWRLQPGTRLRTLAAMWLGVLMLPVGYWAGFVGRPAWGWGVVAASLVAGLGVLPLVAGYAPTPWAEWLGGSLGAILGWALCRFAAYLQSRCGSPSISAYFSS